MTGANTDIVGNLMRCVPDLFSKDESEEMLSIIRTNIADLKTVSSSSMFV